MNKNPLYVLALFILILIGCKSEQDKMKDEITALEKVLKGDSASKPDYSKAETMIKLYETYASKFPDDTLSADYLFRAADISGHINKINEACELYNMVVTKFPKSFRTPYAVFMQAFLYETSLNDIDKAREKYNEFISKYPKHELWDDANQSLVNLGMPLEALVKQWEEKADSSVGNVSGN